MAKNMMSPSVSADDRHMIPDPSYVKASTNEAGDLIQEVDITALESRTSTNETVISSVQANYAKYKVDWINVTSEGVLPSLGDVTSVLNNLLSELPDNSTLYFPYGTYSCTNMIANGIKNLKIICDGDFSILSGGTINTIQFIDCENLEVQNLKIDANNCAVRAILIDHCLNYKLYNPDITNVGNDTTSESTSGIYVRNSADNGLIESPHIDYVHSSNVASGIWLGIAPGDATETETIPRHTLITKPYIKDIYPVGDADGIKVLGGATSAYLTVKDGTFIDCRKRGLKFQSRDCISENNTFIFNEQGYAVVDFQRGFGKSINDTIICNYTADGNANVTNGYMLMLFGIAAGHVDIINPTQKITTDTTWLQNQSSSSAFVRFSSFSSYETDITVIKNINVSGLKGGGFSRLLLNDTTLNIENITLSDMEFKHFYNIMIANSSGEATITKLTYKDNKPAFYGSVNFSYVQLVSSNIEFIEYPATFTYNIRHGSDCKIFSSLSSGRSRNYKLENGKAYFYDTASPQAGGTTSSYKIYTYCKIGDFCWNSNPTVVNNALILGWVCIAIADGTYPNGQWAESKVAI